MTLVTPDVSLDSSLAAGDVTHFWRVPRYHGLDCLRATFRRHSYARHTHETYAVAAIVAGCETFFHRGVQHYAGAGSLAIVCPDELHDGAPHGGGFVYRTFYPSAALMQEIAEDVAGRPLARPPWFPQSVLDDPELVAELTRLHACLSLEGQAAPVIEQDTRLVAFLAKLIARHADFDASPPQPAGRRGIAEVKAYLDDHLADDVELTALAGIAGLSRSHFIRAFRQETGLAPHAYLMDRRFRAASRLLERGEAPGDVAAACGFFDQSHLNRIFKARMAVTPGAYRRAA
ncbi:MAG TPA: AraC family transcriptional regulator [Microvirga sp.]|jgi:AraC-like DNA-binding protein